MYLAGACFAFIGVLRHRPRHVYGAGAAASGLFILLIMTIYLPAHARTHSAHPLLEEVPEVSSARPLVVVGMNLPSLTWYLDEVPERLRVVHLPERLDREDTVTLVLDRRDVPLAGAATLRRLREIGSLGKYVVLEEIEQNSDQKPGATEPPIP